MENVSGTSPSFFRFRKNQIHCFGKTRLGRFPLIRPSTVLQAGRSRKSSPSGTFAPGWSILPIRQWKAPSGCKFPHQQRGASAASQRASGKRAFGSASHAEKNAVLVTVFPEFRKRIRLKRGKDPLFSRQTAGRKLPALEIHQFGHRTPSFLKNNAPS